MVTPSPAVVRAVNPSHGAQGNRRGILAVVAAMAFFVTSDTMSKLAGRTLPLGEMVTLRSLFSVAVLVAIIQVRGQMLPIVMAFQTLPRQKLIWRALAEGLASMSFFLCLVQIPFAESTAIGQMTPLAVTAGAALFLGETVGWRRWLATFVGLIGVLIVIKPGSDAFHPAALWGLGAVAMVAFRDLITRRLHPGFPNLAVAATSVVANLSAGLVLAVLDGWVWPTFWAWVALSLSGAMVVGGFILIIEAMRSGEISVVSPFRYSVMIFALFYAVLVFGETIAPSTILGVTIVVLAGLYTLYRERVRGMAKPAVT